MLSQYPSDAQLAVAWGVAGVGDFDGRVSDRLDGAGHRHVVWKEEVPVTVQDRLGTLEGALRYSSLTFSCRWAASWLMRSVPLSLARARRWRTRSFMFLTCRSSATTKTRLFRHPHSPVGPLVLGNLLDQRRKPWGSALMANAS